MKSIDWSQKEILIPLLYNMYFSHRTEILKRVTQRKHKALSLSLSLPRPSLNTDTRGRIHKISNSVSDARDLDSPRELRFAEHFWNPCTTIFLLLPRARSFFLCPSLSFLRNDYIRLLSRFELAHGIERGRRREENSA